MGREPARQRPGADRRHARRARSHRRATSRRPATTTASSCRWRPSVLFTDPVFRDGAFTANDPAVRAYAVQKTMRAMDLGAELGAKIFVLWGGREGTETDACREPDDAVKRLREAIDFLCEYSIDQKYGYRFALEAKPNEPRGDIYMATTGNYLGSHPDAGAPRAGRRQSGGRARDDGRAELPARGGAGVGGGQAVPHRPERPGDRALRPGLPLWRGQPQGARSSS